MGYCANQMREYSFKRLKSWRAYNMEKLQSENLVPIFEYLLSPMDIQTPEINLLGPCFAI